ncbi:MAG: glycosyltransferase family 4 protein [Geminicoccaceae bacterium]|nr:glycosyltransferase family 4 protein [Geminicoccaceae bacterium]
MPIRIAFHAPMKSPNHPVPSGDRRMARAFMKLLRDLGHEVELATPFRSFEREGDHARQIEIRDAALAEARRMIEDSAFRPDLWFTYHAYHKAPDWIGPGVTRAMGIPYVVAEASIAGKQAGGPWASGHAATLEGLAHASHLLAMTRVDLAGLEHHLPDVPATLFPPFLDARRYHLAADRRRLAAIHTIDPDKQWLIAVAMMRDDVKRQSFELLAETFARLESDNVQLLLIGDGVARPEIEQMFVHIGDRVHFLGEQEPDEVAALLASCDLMLWPALREAYGMALLEAQAAGLPVVACDEGGVSDVVSHGETGFLVKGRDPAQLAEAAESLLVDHTRREMFARTARKRALDVHDATVAASRLAGVLATVTKR